MNINKLCGLLLLLFLGFSGQVLAQEETECVTFEPGAPETTDIIFTYGSAVNAAATRNITSFTLGQTIVDEVRSEDGQAINSYGFWSLFLVPPQEPIVTASQGDFPNRIRLSWQVGPLSSPPSDGFIILRDGDYLAEIEEGNFEFLDFNVQAGEVYEYSVIGKNALGRGSAGNGTGFVNPNGVVSGKITTITSNPVPGTIVTMDPTTGTALSFDGEGSYLCASHSDSLPTDMFTASTWVKIGDTWDSDGILDLGSDLDQNFWIHTTPSTAGKGVVVGIGDGTSTQHELSYEFEEDVDDWHHVTFVFGANTILLYVDGQFVSSRPTAAISNTAALFNIGSKRDKSHFFDGALDDIRIYDRALSQTEILLTKDISVPGNTDGLVAYWKLDEGIGAKVFDLSKNKINAIIYGPTFIGDTPDIKNAGISDEGGNYIIEGINYSEVQSFEVTPSKLFYSNSALEFNAAYEAHATLTNFDVADNATIEVTVHPFDLQRNQTILSNGSDDFVVSVQAGIYKVTINGTTTDLDAATNSYSKLAFVIDKAKNEVKYYRNGDLKQTLSNTTMKEDLSLNKWVLGATGADSPSNYYTGLIDEVAFYDTTLTISQLQLNASLAESGGTNTGSPELANYFSLNEGSGTELRDVGAGLSGFGTIKNATFSTIAYSQKTDPHLYRPNIRRVNLNTSNTAIGEVNFTDESQVAISGSIRFADTDCYQDSVEILVNGDPYSPRIFTDSLGKFVASFEPGVSVKLTPEFAEHKFSPGFYEVRKINQPVAGVTFFNNTKREVEGQVFGGSNPLCRSSIVPFREGTEEVIKVVLQAEAQNGCYEQTLQIDNKEGKFIFKNLPPVPMTFSVIEHNSSTIYDYFQEQGGTAIDLKRVEKDTVDFNYIAGPNVLIGRVKDTIAIDCPLDLPASVSDLPLIYESQHLLAKNSKGPKIYANEIRVYEDYFGEQCFLDSFNLAINNGLQESPQEMLVSDSSTYIYEFYINNPNLLFPHDKSMQVVASVNGSTASATYEAIVLGERQKERTFTTRGPSEIYAVIHDPPGDGSSATWESGTGGCRTLESARMNSTSEELDLEFKFGQKKTIFAGVGGGTIETVLDATNTTTINASFSQEFGSSESLDVCWQTTKSISTSDGDDIWGEYADVYFGAAMNFEIGARDVVDIDLENCRFLDTVVLSINPADSFATDFVYSQWQLLTDVIPTLRSTGNSLDSMEADNWENEIRKNRSKLSRIVDSSTDQETVDIGIGISVPVPQTSNSPIIARNNITFDAGTSYTQTYTSSTESSNTVVRNFNFGGGIETEFGLALFGAGTSQNLNISYTRNNENSTTNTNLTEKTTEFTLADDDLNDFYSVDIAIDPDYDTPIFRLRGGESMCPWIPGTRNREEVSITVEEATAINIPANTPAVFRLTIGNIGQNGDDGLIYELGVDEGGNPDGAIIKVDGQPLISPIQFQFIGEQSFQKTLTVEYPGTGQFDFANLGIYFSSVCQLEHSESVGYDAGDGGFLIYDDYSLNGEQDGVDDNGTGEDYYNRFYKQLKLDAFFIEPCSPVDISAPRQNHVVNPGEELLSITVDEFIKSDPDLELIRVQYRPIPGNGSWINITELPKASLPNSVNFTEVQWDMSPLKDGNYELRALTQCFDVSLNPGFSEVILVTKSTLPPVVLGEPQPADGILSRGDEISITFNKDIRCDEIFTAENVGGQIFNRNLGLYNAETGALIDATISCSGNKIIIVPNIQDRFIENQLLRVKVDGIKDLFGNESEEIVWEFLSNKSSLNWEGLNIEEAKEIGELKSVVREISNQGPSAVLYTIENIPSWMIVNPSEGTVQPGERIQVSFTFPDFLTIDDYETTLQLTTSEGEEPLDVMLRVRCPSPDWVFDRERDFENTQNFTVQIDIFGEMSEDPTDRVAAFINGELRGVAGIQYVRPLDKYIAFLTVYGDEGPNVPIDLRIWDASQCTVYPETIEDFNYIQGEIIGRLGEPQILHVENVVERKIDISPGWNWISVNVDLSDNTTTNVLRTARNPENALIKDNNSFSEYVASADRWSGSLSTISYKPRYMYFSESTDTLCLEGIPYAPANSPIAIKKGWNWLGFVPQLGTSVDRALESLNPLNGDLIKSQTQFAQYITGFGWLGDLNFMEPPNGYLLYISQDGTLSYPDVDVAESFAGGRSNNRSIWDIESSLYQHSMNTVAIIRGAESLKEGDEIGVFVGTELRGKGQAIYIEPMDAYMAFITSYANQDGEKLSFAYYNRATETVTDLKETLLFDADDRVGKITDPFIFTLAEDTESTFTTTTEVIEHLEGLTVYPNPAQDQVFINFAVKATADMQILVTDVLGRTLEEKEVTVPQGVSTLSWETKNLEDGVYFLRFRNETGEQVKKIMISRK